MLGFSHLLFAQFIRFSWSEAPSELAILKLVSSSACLVLGESRDSYNHQYIVEGTVSPKALAPAVWLFFHSLGLGEACGDFLLMFFGSNHTIHFYQREMWVYSFVFLPF